MRAELRLKDGQIIGFISLPETFMTEPKAIVYNNSVFERVTCMGFENLSVYQEVFCWWAQ